MATINYDELCLTKMEELDMLIQNGEVKNTRQSVGLIDALRSAENTSQVSINTMVDTGDGKNNKVIVKYLWPDAEADATDTEADFCDTDGSTSAYQYQDVVVEHYAGSRIVEFTETEMRDFCETGSEFAQKQINLAIDSVLRKANAGAISQFYAGVGGILSSGGTSGQEYEILWRDTQLTTNPEGVILMQQDLMNLGIMDAIFVGDANIYMYTKLAGIACCNALGFDSSQAGELKLYYDNQVSPTLGPSLANTFLGFAPGSAAFLTKPKYQGEFRKTVQGLFIHDTFTDPITGITFDFDMKYDDCTGKYKWRLGLPYEVWQMPSIFKSTDDRDGVNYNFAFVATEGSAS